jgi:hypothetical protein
VSGITSLPVELRPLSDFSPAAYNPRVTLKPGDPEYEAIQESLRRFGLVDKLVGNKRTGNLVAGHQRYNILAAQGITEADFVVGDWPIEDEKELNLILNNLEGRWDSHKLADVVHELSSAGRNLELAGFGAAQLTTILDSWGANHSTDFLAGILADDNGAPKPFGSVLNSSALGLSGFGPASPSTPSATPTPPPMGHQAQDEDEGDEGDDEEGDGQWYSGAGTPGHAAAASPQAPYAGSPAGPGGTGAPSAPAPGAPLQYTSVAYFQISYAVTAEQRTIVNSALQAARQMWHLPTSQEALVAICDAFLKASTVAPATND